MVRSIREVAASLGARVVEWFVSGGGHYKIKVERGGKMITVVTAGSASDWRADMNNRRKASRLISALPIGEVAC